ncbi:MAG: outer membrane beta-barrel protein [Bacteroidales bacterium]|nr:outer membrane beta-barrel protein [Bacteroidales bacterium]
MNLQETSLNRRSALRECIFVLFLLTSPALFAQKGTVSGTIVDTEGEPLPGATVVVMQTDSTQVTGQSTKTDGTFSLTGIKYGDYLLRASYVGYKTVYRSITLSKQNKKMLMGEITLQDNARLLKDAVVTAQLAQVEMKADTFVYNADAFRIPAGSNFEALLKKFPGAEITEEGTIKINGKEVKRILVNQKEFFGDDTKMTLKNLQADMVSKVKAYDRQSDYTRVTGIDDGEEETVLDLTIREGMGEGWRLNLDGGYGTEDRYRANLNLTRFNETWRVAVFGNANNTGDRGWGGFGGWGGGGGLIETQTGGGDFAWQNDKREGDAGFVEVGGNVRFNHTNTENLTISNSQTFVTSAVSQYVNSRSQSTSDSKSLNGDFRLEWQPDSLTNIQFRPRFSYSNSDNNSRSANVTFSGDPYAAGMTDPLEEYGLLDDSDTLRVNANNRWSFGDNNNYNLNGSLQINRRLQKPGRNLTLDLSGNISESEGTNNNRSLIHYYKKTVPLTFNNQSNTSPSDNWNYRARLSYSEPIFTGANLQFSYQFQRRFSDSDRSLLTNVQDMLTTQFAGMTDEQIATQLYAGYLAGVDTLQLTKDLYNSQYAKYNEYNHDATIMLRYQISDLRLNAGLSLQPQTTHMIYQKNNQDFDITRNVFNWAPRVDLRWKISNTSQWRLRYNGRMSQPSMTNLLDVEDTSDPLNQSHGNPNLKPSWTNSFSTSYNDYVVDRQMGWNFNGGFSQTNNSFSSRTIYDTTTGVRTTTPENINGNWNAYIWAGFNTALGPKKYWNVSNNVNLNYSNNVAYMQAQDQTSVKATTKSLSVGDNLRLNFRYDWGESGYGVDLGVNGGFDYRHARNDIQSSMNLDTWSYNYGGNFMLNFGWNMTLSSDISMQARRGYNDDSMNTDELIWNAQLQQTFFKGSLILALEWYDILGERSNISRMISATQRSDTWSNSIYSYGMFRVTYNLNLMGSREARQGMDFPGGWGGGGGRGGRGGGFGGPGGGRR